MRLYEYRQSATSPLKYHLELNPEEFKMTKELVMDIMEKVEKEKRNEEIEAKTWIETHTDIVEWMTEPTKFQQRSDY